MRKTFDKGFLYIIPGLLGFASFYVLPFFLSLAYSFLSKPVGGVFVGLTNYISLFQSEAYIKGLGNTIIFIALCIPLCMLLSLFTAMLVNISGRYKGLFIFIFLIPLVIPSGSTVFFWKLLGARLGLLESAQARLLLPILFIWKNLGYSMVLFLSGFSGIPKDYYEAASLDGAPGLTRFLRITLPCLAPTVVLLMIMSVINSFKLFREIYMIMGNYPHESVYMLQHFMNNMFQSLNYPRLTTATTILVLGLTALSQGLLRLERKAADG